MKPKLSPLCPTFAWLRWAKLVSCVVCLLTLCPAPCALRQIPQGFNYQAIVRDASNEIIAGQSMTVTIALHANSGTGTLLWEEANAVTSDQFGLVSFVVGDGSRTGGLADFTDIDWNAQTVFLKTTVEYPSGVFTVMGTTQIWAVPYSLVAKDVEGPVEVDKIGITGTTTDDEEALFEVKNKDGQIIFAVYNEGVRIYVNDIDAKGAKGGFAIGGFGMEKTIPHEYLFISGDSVRFYIDNSDTDKGPKGGFAIGGFGAVKGLNQKYLMVSNDSVRIYVDNTDADKGVKGGFAIGGYGAAKGKPQDLLIVNNDSVRIYIDKAEVDKSVKGGFAIGGYGTAKAQEEEYLRVTRDSTRVYVNENAKSASGGFAIGGIGAVPGTVTTFTSLTPENYFIGHSAGSLISTGKFNSFIGYQSGMNTTTGNSNTFMGYQSGYKNNKGLGNLYVGYQAGYSTTTGNASQFIGYMSGYSNTTGTVNTFVGTYSGLMNTKGSYNTYVGNNTGGMDSLGKYNAYFGYETGSMTQGSWNTYIGSKSGNENNDGSYNSFLGMNSGGRSTGSNNVFIGYNSGNVSDASSSVYLGYYAGYSFDRSNSLIIANNNTTPYESNALIYGEFDNKLLRINGQLLLPYNSGNSVLTMTMGNGNNMFFKTEGDLLRIQSDHTGNPTVLWLDKYGQAGIGSSLSVPGSLYAAYTSGSVGIGTNSPSYVLHVYKSPSNGTWLSTFQNGTTSVQLAYGGGAGIFMNTNNTSSGLYGLDVYNGTRHVLYAENDGKVGIGTSTPASFLEIVCPGNGIRITRSGSSGYFDFGVNTSGTLVVNNQSLSGATCTGAAWVNSSDRNLKENFIPIDGSEILAKLNELQVTSWNYKGDREDIKHIGPVAQDFYRIFGLGNDDRSISTIDPAGISLLAIQELNRKDQIQQQEIESLNEKVTRLERLVEQLMQE